MKMIDHVCAATVEYIDRMPKSKRKKYGQFFTSKETAVFMAGLFSIPEGRTSLSILDPGAGSGILSVALLEQLESNAEIDTIELVCYENDANIVDLLRSNLEWVCSHTTKDVSFRIVTDNYILSQMLEYNDNKVNLCSITDHDNFSYEMYRGLKAAESMDNSILRVLPSVEFSVCFASEGKESVIHVVTIFSDENDVKVQNLERILQKNRPNYNDAYREEEFLALLREVDMNTILIAHQKNTLTSRNPRKNDANSLGNQQFLEFVYTDYFEAFEFKNRRNEVLNKTFLFQQDIEQKIRFVTGTDCHDWSVYPSETPEKLLTDGFPYTFAKCLPTFKGLVMAITDHTRLKCVNSFFNVDKKTLEEIKFEHSGTTFTIPLSKGINAIIGDNSIGKSLLLHALTGYKKKSQSLSVKVKDGYKRYLKDNGIFQICN